MSGRATRASRRPARAAAAALALACLVAGVIALAPASASAQSVDRTALDRLDPAVRDEVVRIADMARARGVPEEPLVLTALEGASKRAPGTRIVEAVRQRFAALTAAKDALGPESTPDEIAAGAGALMSGVPADTLTRLRRARPKGSLLVPLVVLADLVTRRVPIDTASLAVLHASRIGVADADLLQLRSRVESDIRKGVSPSAATIARMQGLGAASPPRQTPPGGPK